MSEPETLPQELRHWASLNGVANDVSHIENLAADTLEILRNQGDLLTRLVRSYHPVCERPENVPMFIWCGICTAIETWQTTIHTHF